MPEEPGTAAFRDLLQPCALEDFLSGPYGRAPWHGRQDAASRRALIGWGDVNQALGCTRAWDDRTLRLALRGRPVPVADYCVPQEGPSGTIWRPVADRVTRALQAGATLVASGVDGLIPAVGELAQSIEKSLPVRVQANLYISAAGMAGFPRHDDSHDVIVVHLSGRKRWAVHAPERGACSGAPGDAGPPREGLVRRFILEPGDLLYVPQGWPHEALADTDGCLHLSFALVHLSLDDVARALVQQLSPGGEAGLPLYDLHAGPQAMAAHIDRVLQRLQALRADGTFAAGLLRGLLDGRRPRSRYALAAAGGDERTGGRPDLPKPPIEPGR